MNRAIHRFFASFSLGLLFLAGAAAANAQTNPATAAPERVMKHLEEVKQRLALTPEQIERVRPIWINEFEQLGALRDKYAGQTTRISRMKMAREAKEIHEKTEKQLKTILSRQQMDELKKIREERREEFKAQRKARGQ